MAEKILNTRILLKYDTLENWNKSTGILRAGEVAIATYDVQTDINSNTNDATHKLNNPGNPPQVLVKVGDGKSTFAQLPYITAKAGDVYAWAKQANPVYINADGEYGDLSADFRNALTRIGSLEEFVEDSDIAGKIAAAIAELDVADSAEDNKFVVAVPQTDGKVAVERRALVADDIPELAEDKIAGLTTRLGNIDTKIAGIETTAAENLAEAKKYTDDKVKELADGTVAANTAAIAKLNGAATEEGSVAKALADANNYTDTQVNNARTQLEGYADQAEEDAVKTAKDYVDAEIAKVTGDGEGSLGELEGRVAANEAAIAVINSTDVTKEGSLAKVAKDAADAVGAETTRASNAELALDERLDTVEAFFEAALEDGNGQEVIDTLKEIQDYIKSDETGAAAMAASIKANSDAIGEMPEAGEGEAAPTLVGMIAAAESAASQAVANEKLRAEGEEERIEGLANAAQSAADKAQGEVDALEEVVGTPTEGKTIVEMIADAQAAATYNDTEVRGLIQTNATNISNEVTRATGAENAIKAEIGVDESGNYIALEGEHTTLIAAINAANAGVADNAGEISDIKEQLAGITGTDGILGQAKAYTNEKIQEVNNTITALDGEVVKEVEFTNKSGNGEKVLGGKIEDNKLTVEFDDTLIFVLKAGDSTDLDAPAAT